MASVIYYKKRVGRAFVTAAEDRVILEAFIK